MNVNSFEMIVLSFPRPYDETAQQSVLPLYSSYRFLSLWYIKEPAASSKARLFNTCSSQH